MTLTAIVLVLISAFTHVGWNVLGKRNHPTAAFLLVATLFGCLCLSPSLLFFGRALAVFPAAVWVWLGVTGIFQALYYVALAGAYRTGDMSVVYPLARSVPVALVACISVLLGRRAQLSGFALAGIGLIIAGGFVLPLRRFSVQWSDYRQAATAFALLAAVGTAGYSLVDDHALRLLRAIPGLPVSPVAVTLLYAFFEGLSSAVWLHHPPGGSRRGAAPGARRCGTSRGSTWAARGWRVSSSTWDTRSFWWRWASRRTSATSSPFARSASRWARSSASLPSRSRVTAPNLPVS